MTEEMKRSERRENLNLAVTIISPILIMALMGWLGWSFNIRLHSDIADSEKRSAEMYVPKVWFERSHQETIGSIEKLSDKVEKLGEETAVIKGTLSLSSQNYKPVHGSIPQNQ